MGFFISKRAKRQEPELARVHEESAHSRPIIMRVGSARTCEYRRRRMRRRSCPVVMRTRGRASPGYFKQVRAFYERILLLGQLIHFVKCINWPRELTRAREKSDIANSLYNTPRYRKKYPNTVRWTKNATTSKPTPDEYETQNDNFSRSATKNGIKKTNVLGIATKILFARRVPFAGSPY